MRCLPSGVQTASLVVKAVPPCWKLPCEICRGPAVGRNDEQVRVSRLEVAGAVKAVDQPVDDLGGLGPLGALRSGGHIDDFPGLARHVRGERHPFAVR